MEPNPERLTNTFISDANTGLTLMEWQVSSAGYAAVWATENTREAIFDAMERRETYATTGTRMSVRFFGGYDFAPEDATTRNPAMIGYAEGVPMGGELGPDPQGRAPTFLVAALRDPIGANLDRYQIVKGWLDAEGNPQEQVYDVAWSDDRVPGADGKLPPVGSTVDEATATWTNTIGAPELIAVWTDPDFDPALPAFYYGRVLEIPTPRWTAYDAVYFGTEPCPARSCNCRNAPTRRPSGTRRAVDPRAGRGPTRAARLPPPPSVPPPERAPHPPLPAATRSGTPPRRAAAAARTRPDRPRSPSQSSDSLPWSGDPPSTPWPPHPPPPAPIPAGSALTGSTTPPPAPVSAPQPHTHPVTSIRHPEHIRQESGLHIGRKEPLLRPHHDPDPVPWSRPDRTGQRAFLCRAADPQLLPNPQGAPHPALTAHASPEPPSNPRPPSRQRRGNTNSPRTPA